MSRSGSKQHIDFAALEAELPKHFRCIFTNARRGTFRDIRGAAQQHRRTERPHGSAVGRRNVDHHPYTAGLLVIERLACRLHRPAGHLPRVETRHPRSACIVGEDCIDQLFQFETICEPDIGRVEARVVDPFRVAQYLRHAHPVRFVRPADRETAVAALIDLIRRDQGCAVPAGLGTMPREK